MPVSLRHISLLAEIRGWVHLETVSLSEMVVVFEREENSGMT